MTTPPNTKPEFQQRLSVEALKAWESLAYGMFIHYSMNTYQDVDHAHGDSPTADFNPKNVDCAQWARVAREAGMTYGVLTAKHDSGFCLWPSQHTDYHVGHSPWKRDIVADYVNAFRNEGLQPGLYYCCWDEHTKFGSMMPSNVKDDGTFDYRDVYATEPYMEYVWNQLDELVTGYGPLVEIWIDIPVILPPHFRNKLYDHLASRQPEMLIVTNNGMQDPPGLLPYYSWPTDVYTIEKAQPLSSFGDPNHHRVYQQDYYLPTEVCDHVGQKYWFCVKDDQPKSDLEILGTYLLNRSRGSNYLLNVGPSAEGTVPDRFVGALQRLRANLDQLGVQ